MKWAKAACNSWLLASVTTGAGRVGERAGRAARLVLRGGVCEHEEERSTLRGVGLLRRRSDGAGMAYCLGHGVVPGMLGRLRGSARLGGKDEGASSESDACEYDLAPGGTRRLCGSSSLGAQKMRMSPGSLAPEGSSQRRCPEMATAALMSSSVGGGFQVRRGRRSRNSWKVRPSAACDSSLR